MGKCPARIDDMDIYRIIRLLNRFDYIQTLLCCSGHEIWEERENGNLPYVELRYSDKKGIALAKYIKLLLDADYKLKKNHPGRIKPYLEIYDDSSLKIKGKYEGDFGIDEKLIRQIVMSFWIVVRNAILVFKQKHKG